MTPPEAVATYGLSEVIAALSHALDLTEGQPVGHSQRSCLIGMALAERLDLPPDMRQELFYAVLLKDAGCSTSAARLAEVFRVDDRAFKRDLAMVEWSSPLSFARFAARQASGGGTRVARAAHVLRALATMAVEAEGLKEARCDRGARLVAMMGFSPTTAQAVRSLDEHWDGGGRPDRLAGEAIPLIARIACLAQTADVYTTVSGPEAARAVVRKRRGRWFDPRVADAFLAIGDDDPLWDRLVDDNIAELLCALEPGSAVAVADEHGLDRVAEAFAGVVDAKSHYTARHSAGVATYAVGIGEQLGFSEERLRWLRRAALLHDIGKLGVSNRILDKPGRLTDEEREEVKRHPRYTLEILGQISAFDRIAEDAARHHERLDGRGYPWGLTSDQLSDEARVLAVADVYEALTAQRPYRDPLPRDRVLAIMAQEAGTAFDPACLDALAEATALLDVPL